MNNKNDWLPAYPNPEACLFKPNVPFWKQIPNGMVIGKMIEIQGFVPSGSDSFQINLANSRDDGPIVSDRPLHISIRPYYKVVVRNVFQDGHYGHEEREGQFPFETEKQFLIFILLEKSGFCIAVNCKHRWDFQHRLPYSSITMLNIQGVVRIDEVRFREPYFGVNTEITKSNSKYGASTSTRQPAISPEVPYFHLLPEGLYPGERIFISGRPTGNAKRFAVNFVCSQMPYSPPEDVAFHLDVRLFKDHIVRNSRVNEKWGREEADIPFFPFKPGAFFDMIIEIREDKYMVAINGQHFLEFQHRLFPLAKVNLIHIEEDVILTSIRFGVK